MSNHYPTTQEIADHAAKATKLSQERHKTPLLPARVRQIGAGVLAVVALSFVGNQLSSTNQAPEKTTTVEVGGEYPTVWSLAEKISDENTEDIRETVHAILKLNPEVDPGKINGVTKLEVPLSDLAQGVHDEQDLGANLPEDPQTHVR